MTNITIEASDPLVLVGLYSQLRPHFKHRLCDECTTCIREGRLSLLLLAKDRDRNIAGISGVYRNSKQEEMGFTVVIGGFESKGLATRLLKERIKLMPTAVSKVWEGNRGSVRICEKAGLSLVGSEIIYSKRDGDEKRTLIFKKMG